MSNKAQTSNISLKTLRGVFEQPKMHHRRDFLRENKLNLRELQKATTNKLSQQKQELENRQQKHLERFQKTRKQPFTLKLASQCRDGEQNGSRQSRIAAVVDDGGGTTNCNDSVCRARHRQHQKQREAQYRFQMPRTSSSVSVQSKADSCDKEIQTEDIKDEHFLYEALKKCSSWKANHPHRQKSSDQLQIEDNYHHHTNSNCNIDYNEHDHDHCEDNKFQHEQMLQLTARSENSRILNGIHHNYNQHEVAREHCRHEDLEKDFEHLKITPHKKCETEQQLSASSRQTLCSISSKRTANGHKLGCREDVRLPRYLEKEKRKKEEERLREFNRDPNCPLGYYALSEDERLRCLNKAKHRMDSLINELNHMPMTSETLRIRNRKVEIEKELTQIELDIRFYSKRKVYVAEPPIEC